MKHLLLPLLILLTRPLPSQTHPDSYVRLAFASNQRIRQQQVILPHADRGHRTHGRDTVPARGVHGADGHWRNDTTDPELQPRILPLPLGLIGGLISSIILSRIITPTIEPIRVPHEQEVAAV